MRLLLVLIFLFSLTTTSFAQDEVWTPDEDGIEYNCTTLEQVQDLINDTEESLLEIGDVPFARINNQVMTVERYISLIVLLTLQKNPQSTVNMDSLLSAAINACSSTQDNPLVSSGDGDTFNVTVTSNANMRSCAATTCDIVAQVTSGQTLKVVGVDGDWYEVEHEDGTAFIASFLTTRAPDNLIATDEPYVDQRTGCIIAFDIKRGDADMNIILTGDKSGDILVDLYRPNESVALKVEGQLDKTFIDTGEAYILQYYRFNIGWPVGIYSLEITLDEETSKIAFEVEERADYNVYVLCN